jgi:hypothetical protein
MAHNGLIVTIVTAQYYTGTYLYLSKINYMKKNMGSVDRIIRLVLAAVFAILFFTNTVTGTFGIILLVLAVVFILTSLVGFCPLYTIVGMNTCSVKK